MRTYIAIHNGRKVEIQAETQYEAQQKAAATLGVKANKAYTIALGLADVEHNGRDL